MLNSELSHVCYRSGKIQGKNISARLGEVREILPLLEKSGKSEILFNLAEALFVMRNADPFWQLIDSHKHFYFPCVIQVTL